MSVASEPFQFPSGNLGHLDKEQQAAFEELKRLFSERDDTVRDDGLLLRFLRARKFDAQAALKQLLETEQWREDNRIEALYQSIDIDEYEAARLLYTMWTGRRDKRGFPFYVFDIGAVDTSLVTAYENSAPLRGIEIPSKTPVKMLKLFALYEHLVQFVCPWTTALPSRPFQETTPITQGCYIVDISKMGLRQAWSLKSHLQDSSTLATMHYPETLGTIFIVGAPSFFPTIWGWIKRWMDPIVVAKIHILSSKQVLPALSDQVGIENVPKRYGGKLDWDFGDLPIIDQELLDLVEPMEPGTEVDVPLGPIKWVRRSDGRMIMTALGSVDGEQRCIELGMLKKGYSLTRRDGQ